MWKQRRLLMSIEGGTPPIAAYIKFADKEVEKLCIQHFSSDKIGVSYSDAEIVTSLKNVFKNNTNIKTFNELEFFKAIINFDSLYNGQTFTGNFTGCTNLTSISIPKNTKKISFTFDGCINLENIIFDNNNLLEEFGDKLEGTKVNFDINFPNMKTLSSRTFYHTNIHKIINLGKQTEFRERYTSSHEWVGHFSKCTELEYAALPSSTTKALSTFSKCIKLNTIIVHAITPPAINSRTFLECPLNDGIFIPDASVDAYKAAPNWSAYADKIKPLSTYVEV